MLILCCHKINNKSNFETHIDYLKKYYNILSASEFKSILASQKRISKKELLITFDDGDLSLSPHALPIFQKHHVPAVAFVVTSLINATQPFWWNEVEYYFGSKDEVRRLKTVPDEERLHYIEQLRTTGKPKMMYPQLTVEQLH